MDVRVQGTGNGCQGAGYGEWMSGCRVQKMDVRVQGAGRQDARCRKLDVGCRELESIDLEENEKLVDVVMSPEEPNTEQSSQLPPCFEIFVSFYFALTFFKRERT